MKETATFALFSPLGKVLVGHLPAFEISGLCYILAGVSLACLGGFSKNSAYGGPMRRSDLPLFAASVMTGGVIGPVLLLLGLRLVAAHQGALLMNLEAVFTILGGVIVGRERPDGRGVTGACGIVAASALISWQTVGGSAEASGGCAGS